MNLKPCPHCGNIEPYMTTILWSCKQITCDQCSMKGPSGYERDVADKWNALPRAPQWSKELPTEPGLYLRREGAHYNDVIRVRRLNRQLMWNGVPSLAPAKELNTSWGNYEFARIPDPSEPAKETANVV